MWRVVRAVVVLLFVTEFIADAIETNFDSSGEDSGRLMRSQKNEDSITRSTGDMAQDVIADDIDINFAANGDELLSQAEVDDLKDAMPNLAAASLHLSAGLTGALGQSHAFQSATSQLQGIVKDELQIIEQDSKLGSASNPVAALANVGPRKKHVAKGMLDHWRRARQAVQWFSQEWTTTVQSLCGQEVSPEFAAALAQPCKRQRKAHGSLLESMTNSTAPELSSPGSGVSVASRRREITELQSAHTQVGTLITVLAKLEGVNEMMSSVMDRVSNKKASATTLRQDLMVLMDSLSQQLEGSKAATTILTSTDKVIGRYKESAGWRDD